MSCPHPYDSIHHLVSEISAFGKVPLILWCESCGAVQNLKNQPGEWHVPRSVAGAKEGNG